MKIPQVKPDWATGIYNGRTVMKPKPCSYCKGKGVVTEKTSEAWKDEWSVTMTHTNTPCPKCVERTEE